MLLRAPGVSLLDLSAQPLPPGCGPQIAALPALADLRLSGCEIRIDDLRQLLAGLRACERGGGSGDGGGGGPRRSSSGTPAAAGGAAAGGLRVLGLTDVRLLGVPEGASAADELAGVGLPRGLRELFVSLVRGYGNDKGCMHRYMRGRHEWVGSGGRHEWVGSDRRLRELLCMGLCLGVVRQPRRGCGTCFAGIHRG